MYSRPLKREPVTKHPWRFHKWEYVDGMVGLFGLVEQCTRCNLVRVTDILSMGNRVWVGPSEMLKSADE